MRTLLFGLAAFAGTALVATPQLLEQATRSPAEEIALANQQHRPPLPVKLGSETISTTWVSWSKPHTVTTARGKDPTGQWETVDAWFNRHADTVAQLQATYLPQDPGPNDTWLLIVGDAIGSLPSKLQGPAPGGQQTIVLDWYTMGPAAPMLMVYTATQEHPETSPEFMKRVSESLWKASSIWPG